MKSQRPKLYIAQGYLPLESGPSKSTPIVHQLPPGGTILINKMVIFYKTWKKCNEIQLTKKQNGLEQIEKPS